MPEFIKMHGAGNSFVMYDNTGGEIRESEMSALAEKQCALRGTDGAIFVLPGEDGCDFRMLFYNSDGSLGEMCGNGARCVARFGYELGLAEDPENIRFLTTAGLVTGRKITEELYEVRLNDPSVIDLHRVVEIDGKEYDCAYVELGDPGIPHALVEMPLDEIKAGDELRELGRKLRYAKEFPKGANVSFYAFTGEDSVRAITFERGVEDFTLACGTGCGSMGVCLALSGRLPGDRLNISMPGGDLSVRVALTEGRIKDLLLTGPTAYA